MCQEVSCRDQYLFLRQFSRQIVMQNSLYYVYHAVHKYTVLNNIFLARTLILDKSKMQYFCQGRLSKTSLQVVQTSENYILFGDSLNSYKYWYFFLKKLCVLQEKEFYSMCEIINWNFSFSEFQRDSSMCRNFVQFCL